MEQYVIGKTLYKAIDGINPPGNEYVGGVDGRVSYRIIQN